MRDFHCMKYTTIIIIIQGMHKCDRSIPTSFFIEVFRLRKAFISNLLLNKQSSPWKGNWKGIARDLGASVKTAECEQKCLQMINVEWNQYKQTLRMSVIQSGSEIWTRLSYWKCEGSTLVITWTQCNIRQHSLQCFLNRIG